MENVHYDTMISDWSHLLLLRIIRYPKPEVSGSACTSTYGIRKGYLLCRLLCWFSPQTSCNTGKQQSPTGSKIKMGKVRIISTVKDNEPAAGRPGRKFVVMNYIKL